MIDEREFWITVRQALLLFVSAIERRFKLGKYKEDGASNS